MKIKTILTTFHFLPSGDIAHTSTLPSSIVHLTTPPLVQFIEFLRQRQKNLVVFSYAVLVLLVVVDAFVNKEHAHTAMEQLPGFWALFGLGACTLIIFLSKWYGHSGIMQREDYYDQ